ncbi:MAG: DUF6686 family protein [Bacteroidota bacterium]
MCNTCNLINLSESRNSQISWCKHCKKYTLLYNNCCMAFNSREFKEFKSLLMNLKDVDYQYSFLGKPHVLIKNNRAEIGISLTRKDTAILVEMITEALSINEVFGIIYDN